MTQGGSIARLTVGAVHDMSVTETELELLRRESGLRTNAQNPNSTAFGLPQMIEDQREICQNRLGISKTTTNEREQIACFRDYVTRRYGNVEKALQFRAEAGWY